MTPEPSVFAAPWEARVFALIVALQDRGLLSWPDFQAQLAAEITAHPTQPYYVSWLHAASDLLDTLALAPLAEVEAAQHALADPGHG